MKTYNKDNKMIIPTIKDLPKENRILGNITIPKEERYKLVRRIRLVKTERIARAKTLLQNKQISKIKPKRITRQLKLRNILVIRSFKSPFTF